MTRQELINAIIEQQDLTVKRLQQNVTRYENDADLDEEETKDMDDMSHQNENKDMQLRMQVQLDQAIQALHHLKSLEETAHEMVETGALVETDKKWLFIGVSFLPFDLKGKEVVGITKLAPAYEIVEGKKKGDNFKLGKNNFTIKNIY